MKTLESAKKLMIALSSIGSLVVIAGVVNDLQYNSTAFMRDNEIKLERRFDDSMQRFVASAERELPKAQYLPVNEENKTTVNGVWEITRIINEQKEVVHSVENGDLAVKMKFELVATSYVRINNDFELEFDISFLHESRTRIALFRSFGAGYEIIEARKVSLAEIENVEKIITEEKSTEKIKEKVAEAKVVIDSMELVLERALHPKKDNNILKGELVDGSLSVTEGMIETFNATIGIGKEYRTTVNFNAVAINAGGQFKVELEEGEVTGIITRNGKEGYRVRFVTGSLAGAMLNFVTEDEKDRILRTEEEAEELRVRNLTEEQKEEVAEQETAENLRREESQIEAVREENIQEEKEEVTYEEEAYDEEDGAERVEVEEGVEVVNNDEALSKREVASKVEETGFEF